MVLSKKSSFIEVTLNRFLFTSEVLSSQTAFFWCYLDEFFPVFRIFCRKLRLSVSQRYCMPILFSLFDNVCMKKL